LETPTPTPVASTTPSATANKTSTTPVAVQPVKKQELDSTGAGFSIKDIKL